MYHQTDPAYIQSLAIKTGEYRLAPEDQELVNWISESQKVKALNFCFETVETIKGYRLQHICIIIETVAECRSMKEGADYNAIINRFVDYFNKYRLVKKDSLKNDIFPPQNRTYPEIVVAFIPLEEVELKIANERATPEIQAMAERYPDIWVLSTNISWRNIFYYTDAQIKENRNNGTSEAIENEVLSILKKYDRFGYFGKHSLQVRFDSKESFERDFDGNWYYYYK